MKTTKNQITREPLDDSYSDEETEQRVKDALRQALNRAPVERAREGV
jgi:hypothetical protein